MGKRVTIAIGAVLAAGLLLLVGINLWLDMLVRTAVEQVVSQLTRTKVTLERVQIGVLKGGVRLDGLEIANPPGFTAPHAVRLGSARTRLAVGTILSDTVVIDEILVDSLDVSYEGIPTSNLGVIQGNVAAAVPAGSSKPAEARTASSASKRLLIKKFSLTNGRIAARIGGESLRLGLPDIHLTDIGKETGGATPEQVVSAVLTAITRSATGVVTDQASRAGSAVSKVEESLKKHFK